MAKFCSSGHQMEDSWEVCPYCQRTGFRSAAGPPVATRLETGPPPVPSGGAAPRKTVLLAEKYKAPVVGWVVALSGDQKGEDFRLVEGQNVLGSGADATVQLRNSTVSGRHASLRYKDQVFVLTDLDSSNGTFLNDRSITREQLKDNDVIRLGDVYLKFKCF